MLNWITSFVKQLGNQISNIQQSCTWRNLPDRCLAGVDGIWKLDGVIMSQVNTNKEDYHIQDVLVPFKLKNDKSLPTQAATDLAKYVYMPKQKLQSYTIKRAQRKSLLCPHRKVTINHLIERVRHDSHDMRVRCKSHDMRVQCESHDIDFYQMRGNNQQ
jgi:hypothetical protein